MDVAGNAAGYVRQDDAVGQLCRWVNQETFPQLATEIVLTVSSLPLVVLLNINIYIVYARCMLLLRLPKHSLGDCPSASILYALLAQHQPAHAAHFASRQQLQLEPFFLAG